MPPETPEALNAQLLARIVELERQIGELQTEWLDTRGHRSDRAGRIAEKQLPATVEIPVYQFAASTDELKALSDDERCLILLTGHAANEISALYRAAHSAARGNRSDADRFTWQVSQSQTLLMLRLIAGKMYELFRVLNRPRFSSHVVKAYPEFTQIRRDIERSIGEVMPLDRGRNKFGFHYNADLFDGIVREQLESISNDATHEIVYEQKSVNTYFGFGEKFFQTVFALHLRQPTTYVAFQDNNITVIVEKFFIASNNLITGLHYVIMGIFDQHGIHIRDASRTKAGVATATPSADARLPSLILYNEHD